MTEIGSVIDGKYEILKEIGRGGMSVVYLAMDKRLNKQWAVKEIRKKGNGKNDEIVVNSLLAEANMMKKLDHPALPRIVEMCIRDRTGIKEKKMKTPVMSSSKSLTEEASIRCMRTFPPKAFSLY